jgi:predicted ATPase
LQECLVPYPKGGLIQRTASRLDEMRSTDWLAQTQGGDD